MTTKTDLGTCCVYGCANPAVELAAPNAPYCSRHASSNRAATAQYMSALNGFRSTEDPLATLEIIAPGKIKLHGKDHTAKMDDGKVLIEGPTTPNGMLVGQGLRHDLFACAI